VTARRDGLLGRNGDPVLQPWLDHASRERRGEQVCMPGTALPPHCRPT
jgi:hypothetical protein